MTSPTPINADKSTPRILAVVACVFAALGMLYPIGPLVELFHEPPGSAVRLMGLGAATGFAAVTPFIVATLSVCAIRRRGTSRILGIVAIAMSLIPLPVSIAVARWIVDAHGLTIKP